MCPVQNVTNVPLRHLPMEYSLAWRVYFGGE